MAGTGNTTVPADPSARTSTPPAEEKVFALVVCQCLPEPEREGEVALFDPAEAVTPWIIGREVEGGPTRVHFFQQRPGEMIDAGALTGTGISQEQLRIALHGDRLRVTNERPGSKVRLLRSRECLPGSSEPLRTSGKPLSGSRERLRASREPLSGSWEPLSASRKPLPRSTRRLPASKEMLPTSKEQRPGSARTLRASRERCSRP